VGASPPIVFFFYLQIVMLHALHLDVSCRHPLV
jgi:hypothetical protein